MLQGEPIVGTDAWPALADLQRWQPFHQIINRFDLDEEWLELVERESAGAIATGLRRVWVCLKEQASQANRHARASQVHHLGPASA